MRDFEKEKSFLYGREKIRVLGPGKFFLRMRRFGSNTSKMRFSLNSKFGPFDILYKLVGSTPKKYFEGSHDLKDEELYVKIRGYLEEKVKADVKAIWGVPINVTFVSSGFWC